MTMTVEQSLTNFHFWGGAEENAKYFTMDELERIDNYFDEDFQDEVRPMSETMVNDVFWFEPWALLEILGYDDGHEEWERRLEEDYRRI